MPRCHFPRRVAAGFLVALGLAGPAGAQTAPPAPESFVRSPQLLALRSLAEGGTTKTANHADHLCRMAAFLARELAP